MRFCIFLFRSIVSLIALFISTQLRAQEFSDLVSGYDHLLAINKQWINYPEAAPKKEVRFNSDTERIQFHLTAVLKSLKANTPYQISKDSKKKRSALIKELQS